MATSLHKVPGLTVLMLFILLSASAHPQSRRLCCMFHTGLFADLSAKSAVSMKVTLKNDGKNR